MVQRHRVRASILQQGVLRVGQHGGNFYMTNDLQQAVDFAGQRTWEDDPYRTILAMRIPQSVLDAMQGAGTLSVSPLFSSITPSWSGS